MASLLFLIFVWLVNNVLQGIDAFHRVDILTATSFNADKRIDKLFDIQTNSVTQTALNLRH